VWFERRARPLPWRQNKDPYAVWVSEVMLQQTQVDTVIPYFLRFLQAFPSITSLAEAPLERVLELWSGLGYYRRARNLRLAAQKVVREFGGVFPSRYEEARSLPGVGDYTARAVLSIAYNQPYAVVDGNVARVVSRLRTLPGNLHQQKFWRVLNEELELIFSRRQPGNFNQAIMELGQSICLPRAPKCPLCPLQSMCQARRDGAPEAYPEPRPRRATETRYLAAVVLCRSHQGWRSRPLDLRCRIRQGKNADFEVCANEGAQPHLARRLQVALELGLDEGLMEELWNFPAAFGISPGEALSRLQARVTDMTASKLRWRSRSGLPHSLAQLRHSITYRSIIVDIYVAEVGGSVANNRLRWFSVSRLPRSAVSSLARKIAERVGLLRTTGGGVAVTNDVAKF
jgi:A/G-specific adenine glycosylase